MSQQFSGNNNIRVTSAVDYKSFNLPKVSFIFHNNLLPKGRKTSILLPLYQIHSNVQQFFREIHKRDADYVFKLHLQICLPIFFATDFKTDSGSLFEKISCLLRKQERGNSCSGLCFQNILKRVIWKKVRALLEIIFNLVIRGWWRVIIYYGLNYMVGKIRKNSIFFFYVRVLEGTRHGLNSKELGG